MGSLFSKKGGSEEKHGNANLQKTSPLPKPEPTTMLGTINYNMFSDLPVHWLSERIGNLDLHISQPVSNRSESLSFGQQASRFTYLHRPSLAPQELRSSVKPSSYTSPARPPADAPTHLGSVGKVDLRAKAKTSPIKPTRLRYSDLKEYAQTFRSLVKLEAEYEKEMIESQKINNVAITWDTTSTNKTYGYFELPEMDDNQVDFSVGKRYVLWPSKAVKEDESVECELIQVPDEINKDYCLRVLKAANVPTLHEEFMIKAVWCDITYRRMLSSLAAIQSGQISSRLSSILCGTLKTYNAPFSEPFNCLLNVPGVSEIDESQNKAIMQGLKNMVCLIQGPPGTGKTNTSVCLIYHLKWITGVKVIAMAPSNTAVDNLCKRLIETGLNVVRLCAATREEQSDSLKDFQVHVKARKLNPELACLQRRKDDGLLKSRAELTYYLKLKKRTEIRVLEEADVICCTCVMAADTRMGSIDFTNVLIDECGQALEPECLIPISRDVSRLILVGDQCQLGPVVQCPEAVTAGLDRSLFERFHALGVPFVRLETQYRMHPELARFPSQIFYDNKIRNGEVTLNRRCCRNFPWPNHQIPTFFYCIEGVERLAANGVSYVNPEEAQAVKDVINSLISGGVSRTQIGVIAPYVGQKVYLTQQLGRIATDRNNKVEISSVDGYQGREKNYIILSCVRSNRDQNMGFLTDPRRLNVALTRAQLGLVVIGNPTTLSRDPLWNALLHFYHERNLLVKGPLRSLQQGTLTSHKPKVAYTYKPKVKWLD